LKLLTSSRGALRDALQNLKQGLRAANRHRLYRRRMKKGVDYAAWIARRNVVYVDPATGREIRGAALARLSPSAIRPYEEVTVTGQPAVALLPGAAPPDGGDPAEATAPYRVRAPRIVLEGEEDFAAFGGASQPEFLSTHPAPGSRIEELRSLLPQVMPIYEANRRQ